MIESSVQAQSFFEARQAALLVQTASKFECGITLRIGDKKANAKSIMGVISLGIEDGQTVIIQTEGEDEHIALPVMEDFFTVGNNK